MPSTPPYGSCRSLQILKPTRSINPDGKVTGPFGPEANQSCIYTSAYAKTCHAIDWMTEKKKGCHPGSLDWDMFSSCASQARSTVFKGLWNVLVNQMHCDRLFMRPFYPWTDFPLRWTVVYCLRLLSWHWSSQHRLL